MQGRVLRLSESSFVLDTKEGEQEFLYSALDAESLLREARSKKGFEGQDAWNGVYLRFISGAKVTARMYDESGDPQLKPLLEGLGDRGDSAAALAALAEIAAMSSPSNPKDAGMERRCFTLSVLMFGKTPAFQARKAALAELARCLIWSTFDENNPSTFGLEGKCEALGDGRFRLGYDFEDEKQASDFHRIEYLNEIRGHELVRIAQKLPSDFIVRSGVFEGLGACCYELPIVFASPMTIKFRGTLKRDVTPTDMFLLGFCDDGEGGMIASEGVVRVLRIDDNATILDRVGANRIDLGRAYHIELRHDGRSTVSLHCDGKRLGEATCGLRMKGRVILRLHSDGAVQIDDLVIEGKLDPISIASLRALQIEEGLNDLGLD